MRRSIGWFTAVVVLVAACGASPAPVATVDPLPLLTAQEFGSLLEDSDRPVVVNVWASWCIPCRSEAPLLRIAHQQFADRVRFIGVDTQDSQPGAQAFLAEFDLPFEHYFDPTGEIRASLSGLGVPLTFFFEAGGRETYRHFGVIDDRTLALHLDELVRRRGG